MGIASTCVAGRVGILASSIRTGHDERQRLHRQDRHADLRLRRDDEIHHGSVNGDSKKEANETFYLDLFGNSGKSLFTKNRGLGTILNDD